VTSSSGASLDRFSEALSKVPIPLDEATFALSAYCQGRPLQLDVELRPLDELAARVADPSFVGVATFLFDELGFAGDNLDYFNPRNSYIEQVLETKLGIPISLAVVMMEVSRRCGVETLGIGMPGHFLVGDKEDATRLLDPFRGKIITSQEAENLFAYLNPSVEFRPEFLAETANDAILSRMLNNLRLIHIKRKSTEDLIRILDLMVCWKSPPLGEVKQLAAALDSLGKTDHAARQLDEIAARSRGDLKQQIQALSTQFWRRLN
tara:strand:+ start:67962 stop:68753 length:792 start_codon:yes stop_codon:yes gene_type:complete